LPTFLSFVHVVAIVVVVVSASDAAAVVVVVVVSFLSLIGLADKLRIVN